MTPDEIAKLEPRELDALVAVEVMGWTRPDLHRAPPYSTDYAAAWEVESEIERRDLVQLYVAALSTLVNAGRSLRLMWPMVHASPLDRCRAALGAVAASASTAQEAKP